MGKLTLFPEMKNYICEMKKIEELERLLVSLRSKIKGHEKDLPAIMKAISSIGDILEKHKHNVETSLEYI